MKTSIRNRLSAGAFAAVLAMLTLGTTAQLLALPTMHNDAGGRLTPWTNCAGCHDLKGDPNGSPPACIKCHNEDFDDPDPPPVGHNNVYGAMDHTGYDIDDRLAPFDNCAGCHGADLTGGAIGPSCFTCHDQMWPDPGGGGNSPPVVDPGGNPTGHYSGAVGETIQFDASLTTDPDGDDMLFLWVFEFPPDPGTAPSESPYATHSWDTEGTYTVYLSVMDGESDPEPPTPVTVVIGAQAANDPPTAEPGEPYSGTVGQPVPFDGSDSTDSDGTIASYDWDFGDGQTGTGQTPSHTYTAPDTYTVTLTVTDDDGATDTATTTVEITAASGNQPPVADPGGPYSGTVGQTIQFDGSGSSDADGTIFGYLWDFGDGNVDMGVTPTHAYTSVGTYTVELIVADTGGAMSDPVTTTVEITDDAGPGPGSGSGSGAYGWTVRIPLTDDGFQLSMEPFGGVLLIDEVFADGTVIGGVGLEAAGTISWMDSEGAIFYGTVDYAAGTAKGLVFDFFGTDSIWLAESAPPPVLPPTPPPVHPPTHPPTQPPTLPPGHPPVCPPTHPPVCPPSQPPVSPCGSGMYHGSSGYGLFGFGLFNFGSPRRTACPPQGPQSGYGGWGQSMYRPASQPGMGNYRYYRGQRGRVQSNRFSFGYGFSSQPGFGFNQWRTNR